MKNKYFLTLAILFSAIFSFSQNNIVLNDDGQIVTTTATTSFAKTSAFVNCNNSINSPFDGGNASHGYFMDIDAINNITITQIEIPFEDLSNTVRTIEVWSISGSMVGNTGSSTGWVLEGTKSTVITSVEVVTGLNIQIPQGTTRGILVTVQGTFVGDTDDIRYSNGTAVGNVAAQNSDLITYEGYGTGSGFTNSLFSPRVWNGAICYELTPSCATTNAFSPLTINPSYAAAGANAPDTYYWGLSTGFIKANPTGGVGPYTYQWSSSTGYALKGSTKQRARMWYPTGPQWVKVAITDVGAGCTVEDSVYIDWVDFTCNQPYIWYYQLCNTVTGVSSCVQGTWNMRNLINTGDYVFGPCGAPAKTQWSATDGSTDLGVTVFPNPSNGQFSYIMSNAAEGSYSISVLDMNGRMLYSETIESKDRYTTNELDLSHLSSGMYIFKISNEQTTVAERLVIQ